MKVGPSTVLVEGGAEFEDAGAGGFDRDGEGESGGFVEEEGDAVEFTFTDAASESETDGMEKIAAAEAAGVFQVGDDFLEAFGGEGDGIEEEQREMADYVAGGVAAEGGVGVGGLQDFGGVVVENEAEQIGEGRRGIGEVAQELGGAAGPSGLFDGGIGGEPMVFAEDDENVVGGIGIGAGGRFRDEVVGGHGWELV
jgi:hypothetical protein